MEPKKIIVVVQGGAVSAVYAEGRQNDIKVIVADRDAYEVGESHWINTQLHEPIAEFEKDYFEEHAEIFGEKE